MRCCFLLVFLVGCAKGVPSDPSGNGSGKHDLRRADLLDLTGGGEDLKKPRDLSDPSGDPLDLSDPSGDPPDLKATGDLKAAPTDLAPPADLASSCAAQEDCFNSLDDDCAGGVNNGCPSSITVGTGVSLGFVGGSGGGGGSVRCPSGQMVGAVRYFYDDYDGYMAGMGLFCSTPTLTKGASAYTIGATDILSVSPINFYGTGEDYFDDSENCVSGGAFGTVWHHEIIGANGTPSGVYVDGLKSQCATGTVTLDSSNQLSVSFTTTGSLTGFYYSGATPTNKSCPSGSVLVGYDYRIGSWMDAIAPVCAPIVVTYL